MTPPTDLSALRIEEIPGGVRIRCRVHPAARRSGVDGCHGGALKVSVTAAPERGRANRALVELLAAALDLPRQAVEVVSGETSRLKTVVLAGITAFEVRKRLS